MSPGMVQEALTREGRESLLLIQRGGDVFTVHLKLRRLRHVERVITGTIA